MKLKQRIWSISYLLQLYSSRWTLASYTIPLRSSRYRDLLSHSVTPALVGQNPGRWAMSSWGVFFSLYQGKYRVKFIWSSAHPCLLDMTNQLILLAFTNLFISSWTNSSLEFALVQIIQVSSVYNVHKCVLRFLVKNTQSLLVCGL